MRSIEECTLVLELDGIIYVLLYINILRMVNRCVWDDRKTMIVYKRLKV